MNNKHALYNKILVAIDLSKYSDLPLEKAMKIAAQYKDMTIDVIHVINMAIPYYSYTFSTEIQDAIYLDTKQYFNKFCTKYNIAKERQHLLIGSPKIQILDLVDKLNVDLLIVGSHGDQHILPATFGSTASSLIAKAKCDVLTVTIKHVEHPCKQDNSIQQTEQATL